MGSATTWQILGMVLASAVFWIQYVDFKDKLAPEPRIRLLFAFLLGIIAACLAYAAFTVLEWLGLPSPESGTTLWKAWFCFALIGPIEEGAKILVAILFIFRWQEFDEVIDGFVYAAAISIGFATLENYIQFPALPLTEQLVRTATLPLTHTLFAAIWGFGIGHALLDVKPGPQRVLWIVGSILLGTTAHGLYDFLIFTYHPAFLTSGLVLVIWSWVISRARALAKRSAANSPNPVSIPHAVGNRTSSSH